jgi:TonB family protein
MIAHEPTSTTRIAELDAEYEIVGELGRGGSAIVYHARDRELGRDVAIKVVRSNQADDSEAVTRLEREAKLVAQLRHPNIVPLLSIRHLADGLALIMQHVPGRTLKRAIREDGPLPIAMVEHVVREIASALTYAHGRHGIIHRDIKPENIYLDEECGRALLSDFGIARSTEAESTLTLVGTALGTPAYMSPEQIDGTELDGRSDLFSLGLVAHEMLSGLQPWAGHNLYTVIYKQKHEELPALTTYRNDIPAYLLRAINGLLRKDRDERCSDAALLLAQLPNNVAPLSFAPTRKRPRAVPEVQVDSPTIQYQRAMVEAVAAAPVVEAPAIVKPVIEPAVVKPAAVTPAFAPAPVFEAPAIDEIELPLVVESYPLTVPPTETPVEPVSWDYEDVLAAVTDAQTEREVGTRVRWLTFAGTQQRSRLVAALTAVLVLSASATMVAMIDRDAEQPQRNTNPALVASNTTLNKMQPAQVKSSGVSAPRNTTPTNQNTTKRTVEQNDELPATPSVPTILPPEIALPRAGRTIDTADFSSAAVNGSAPLPVESASDAPAFTPRTIEPELKNRSEVQRALAAHYPTVLRERRIGGTVQLWVRIDENGKVVRSQIKESSGNDALDRAAMRVADVMQFSPALNREQKVSVWLILPIVFRAQ